MMHLQVPYQIVEVPSLDRSHVRKVGLVAVMTDDKSLYSKFKAPGAFNGAAIDCPWGTLTKYKQLLQEEHGCDLVVPLQHLYEHEDQRTLEEFDFPVVLSGHDHHVVDKEVCGTRLLKPGSDGHMAVVLNIVWESPESAAPVFSWEVERVQDYDPDTEMVAEMQEATAVLAGMRHTELSPVPSQFRPLSSVGSRSQVTTMGQLVCSMARDAINGNPQFLGCDFAMIRGGHICGDREYPEDSFFSLEDLETVNTDHVSVCASADSLLAYCCVRLESSRCQVKIS